MGGYLLFKLLDEVFVDFEAEVFDSCSFGGKDHRSCVVRELTLWLGVAEEFKTKDKL